MREGTHGHCKGEPTVACTVGSKGNSKKVVPREGEQGREAETDPPTPINRHIIHNPQVHCSPSPLASNLVVCVMCVQDVSKVFSVLEHEGVLYVVQHHAPSVRTHPKRPCATSKACFRLHRSE